MKRIFFIKEGRKMCRNNIFDIAKFFLSKNDPNMTHKKLQKLCYYAYAWNLALKGEKLFKERFQAWVHGPVSPQLYKKYREHGWQTIPPDDAPLLQNDVIEVLETVYETYGEFTGDELESLTHSELPWIEARGGLPEYEPSTTYLNDQTIINYYCS
ncbi:DUF4065 domain-containing protein [Caldibacillus thermoamylovorans]|uniref:Panacea domain-containing protein n=2 Tax=Bacillales TaxID=1385 RepID=UPI000591B04F|nr:MULTISPECIES: type II toxin-antitoxin system antitoxin SocA domain-containing protein [Bacillaceae]KKB33385.1 putative prophage protein (ps3) [Bacillus thermotolerans]MCB5935243.1 DUF4065 domain-containing protein [Bacillus sp. DFI.2.34]MCB7077763.1 DUF4065 domain-containing protein [Caldibacillus thermoamylovorans]